MPSLMLAPLVVLCRSGTGRSWARCRQGGKDSSSPTIMDLRSMSKVGKEDAVQEDCALRSCCSHLTWHDMQGNKFVSSSLLALVAAILWESNLNEILPCDPTADQLMTWHLSTNCSSDQRRRHTLGAPRLHQDPLQVAIDFCAGTIV